MLINAYFTITARCLKSHIYSILCLMPNSRTLPLYGRALVHKLLEDPTAGIETGLSWTWTHAEHTARYAYKIGSLLPCAWHMSSHKVSAENLFIYLIGMCYAILQNISLIKHGGGRIMMGGDQTVPGTNPRPSAGCSRPSHIRPERKSVSLRAGLDLTAIATLNELL